MRRFSDVVLPASAGLFGLLTWAIAHALTYVLFAHIHPGPVPEVHMHGGAWPDVLALVAFVATIVCAGIAVQILVSGSGPRLAARIAGASPSSAAAACAPAVFVLVEFAQHFASGDEGPPAALVVIGVVLHAATGAVTPLLWSEAIRPTLCAILIVGSEPDGASTRRERVVFVEPSWSGSRHVSPFGSRGPPAGAGRSVLSPCSA